MSVYFEELSGEEYSDIHDGWAELLRVCVALLVVAGEYAEKFVVDGVYSE